ncbi:hypothetical protein BKA70DRAFT_1225149 [Coprinopsis sp. MPI-PUGE-AT-0042]|nr:hypothetical protein BKA70DRAFT_1225149 [Coprinopsis sp. MPI-PUGE-AT-0042]
MLATKQASIDQAITTCGLQIIIEYICKSHGRDTFDHLCEVHKLSTIRGWVQEREVALGVRGSQWKVDHTKQVPVAKSNRGRKGVDVMKQMAENVERLKGNAGRPQLPTEGTSATKMHSSAGTTGDGTKRPREVEDSGSQNERRHKAPRLGVPASSQREAQLRGYLRTPESPASRPLEPQNQPSLEEWTFQTVDPNGKPITPPISPLPSLNVFADRRSSHTGTFAAGSPNPTTDRRTPVPGNRPQGHGRSASHSGVVGYHPHPRPTVTQGSEVTPTPPYSAAPSPSYSPPMHLPMTGGLGLYQFPQASTGMPAMQEPAGTSQPEPPLLSATNAASSPAIATEELNGGHAPHATDFMSQLNDNPLFALHPACVPFFDEGMGQMGVPPAQLPTPLTPGYMQAQEGCLDVPAGGTALSPIVVDDEGCEEELPQGDIDFDVFVQLEPGVQENLDGDDAWMEEIFGPFSRVGTPQAELPGPILEAIATKPSANGTVAEASTTGQAKVADIDERRTSRDLLGHFLSW